MPRAVTERDLDAYLRDERRRIEDALEAMLPALGTSPESYRDAVRYTTLSPAKRIRGIVTLASWDLFSRRNGAALSLACAVEMVHAASLILDDLPSMDDATLRRGKPVLHRVVGEANAILAAFGLLNSAYLAIQEAPGLRDRARREATTCLANAVGPDGLIGGQIQDLEATGNRLDLEALESIHSHKTGALFLAAVEIGAIGAGASPRNLEMLRRFSKNLGLAFQVTDDLLDYAGDPESTGKDAGQDRDRTTFVNLCGIEGARRLVDELIDAAVAALEPLGKKAEILRGIAELVRGRDR